MKRLLVPAVLAGLLVAPATAEAMNPHPRGGWMGGIALGVTKGEATLSDGGTSETELPGISPQFRLGKFIGQHFLVSLNYEGWLIEGGFGGENEADPDAARLRASLQSWQMAVTWFPARPHAAAGGLFVRGGVGPALAGFAIVLLDEQGEQIQKSRLDEWGTAYSLSAGYEIRVAKHAAVGLSMGWNYLDMGGDLYDSASFTPVALNLNWYF